MRKERREERGKRETGQLECAYWRKAGPEIRADALKKEEPDTKEGIVCRMEKPGLERERMYGR